MNKYVLQMNLFTGCVYHNVTRRQNLYLVLYCKEKVPKWSDLLKLYLNYEIAFSTYEYFLHLLIILTCNREALYVKQISSLI